MRFCRFFILLMVMATVSCSKKSETIQKLEQIDSLLYEEADSVAYSILSSIKSEDLNTSEKTMYYNLLKTGLQYRMGDREQTDSVISNCVKFYEKEGDKEKLALSYFYRALVNWRTYGNNVLFDLKQAETQAETVKNYGLLSKIYSAIAEFNSAAEEITSALNYIRKSVDAAKKSGKEWLLVYAYLNSSSIYKENNNQDSSFYFAQQCKAYVEDLLPHYKAYVYYDLGSLLIGSNDSLAEDYLLKSLEYKQLPQAYKSLADIYNVRGNQNAAVEMWNRAVNNNAWLGLKAEILDAKASSEYERNNYAECCKTLKERENVLTTLYESKLENKTLELESKYDYNLQQQRFHSRMVVVGLLVVFMVVVLVSLHQFRVHRIENEKTAVELNYAKTLKDLALTEERIAILQTEKKSNTTELAVLKHKIDTIRETVHQNILKGRRMYDELCANASPLDWTDNDLLNLFDYISTQAPEFVNSLDTDYDKLNNGQKLFLIVDLYLKKTDFEICQMFGLEKASLYNKRNRIEKKRIVSA